MSARGTANALTRTTAILAFLFFALALAMAILSRYEPQATDILDRIPGTSSSGGVLRFARWRSDPHRPAETPRLGQRQRRQQPAPAGGTAAPQAPADAAPALRLRGPALAQRQYGIASSERSVRPQSADLPRMASSAGFVLCEIRPSARENSERWNFSVAESFVKRYPVTPMARYVIHHWRRGLLPRKGIAAALLERCCRRVATV